MAWVADTLHSQVVSRQRRATASGASVSPRHQRVGLRQWRPAHSLEPEPRRVAAASTATGPALASSGHHQQGRLAPSPSTWAPPVAMGLSSTGTRTQSQWCRRTALRLRLTPCPSGSLRHHRRHRHHHRHRPPGAHRQHSVLLLKDTSACTPRRTSSYTGQVLGHQHQTQRAWQS